MLIINNEMNLYVSKKKAGRFLKILFLNIYSTKVVYSVV